MAPEKTAPNATAGTEDVVAALEGRRSFYDLLAAIYFRPLSEDQIERFAALDLAPYEEVSEQFADGIDDIRRYLRKRNTGTRQELAVDYTSSFGGVSTWEGRVATPYESVFTSKEGLMYQESFHEVYRLFKQNGVMRAEGYDYPDDHLSFMFEFLSILSGRMAEAVNASDFDAVLKYSSVSRQLIDDHILSWFDRFSEIANKLVRTRFYRGILKVTEAYLVFDCEVLDEVSAFARAEGATPSEEV